MLDLIVYACLATTCKALPIGLNVGTSPAHCYAYATTALPEWSAANPRWQIKGFECRLVKRPEIDA